MNTPRFLLAIALLATACSSGATGASDENTNDELRHASPTPNVHVKLACSQINQDPSDTSAPLKMLIDLDHGKIEARDLRVTQTHKAHFNPNYHPHDGNEKIQYLVDDHEVFQRGDYEWNEIMLDATVLDNGSGNGTIREEAGDRSEWAYVSCSPATE